MSSSPVRPELARWRLAVTAAFGLGGITISAWGPRLPAIKADLDAGTATLGLLLAGATVGSILGLLASTPLLHWLGGRRAVAGAILLIAAAITVMGLALIVGSVPLIAVAFVITGTGIGTLDVLINVEGAAVERAAGRTLMPRMHAAWSIGAAVGSGIGAACAALAITPAAQFIGEAVLIAAAGLVVAAGIPRGEHAPAEQAPRDRAARFRQWLRGWLNWRLLLIGVVLLGVELGEGSANSWLTLAVRNNHGQTAAVAALFFTVFATCEGLTRIFAGPLVDRLGRVTAVRFTTALGIVGILLFILAGNRWLVLLGVALWAVGVSLGFPLGTSAAAASGPDPVARISVVSSIGYFANLAGPPVIGALAQSAGLLNSLWLIAALFVAAFAVAGSLGPRAAAAEPEPSGIAARRPLPGVSRASLRPAQAVQFGRGATGKGPALAGQVGLVGVARCRRQLGQVRRLVGGVEEADEALEAQDALERLGAVAGRRVRAAAELALAEAHPPGDVLGPRGRVTKQGSGRADGGVGAAVREQRPGHVEDPRGGLRRAQRRGQPAGSVAAEIGEGNALVAQLAQRQAEHLAARRRAEPDADEDRARPCLRIGRPGVRARHVRADALLPDQVAARVGQHEAGVIVAAGDEPRPQARHRAAQDGRCLPLRVPGSEPGTWRDPARRRRPHDSRMPRIGSRHGSQGRDAHDAERVRRLSRRGVDRPVRLRAARERGAGRLPAAQRPDRRGKRQGPAPGAARQVQPHRLRGDHHADPDGDRAAGAGQVPQAVGAGRPGGRPAAGEHLAAALEPVMAVSFKTAAGRHW